MICTAKDLSPEQKAAIESLLGRQILENEAISLRAIEPPPDSEMASRAALQGMIAYFAEVDQQRQQVSAEEADAILDEALRSTRPNYQPVR